MELEGWGREMRVSLDFIFSSSILPVFETMRGLDRGKILFVAGSNIFLNHFSSSSLFRPTVETVG
jgi:hypothetical protein